MKVVLDLVCCAEEAVQHLGAGVLHSQLKDGLEKLREILKLINDCGRFQIKGQSFTEVQQVQENEEKGGRDCCESFSKEGKDLCEDQSTNVICQHECKDEDYFIQSMLTSCQELIPLLSEFLKAAKGTQGQFSTFSKQYNCLNETKSSQIFNLIVDMKKLIREFLELESEKKNDTFEEKSKKDFSGNTSNKENGHARSAGRSLLTEKLKVFQEERAQDEIIPSGGGRYLIKKYWVLKKRDEAKENITEPANSVSNKSEVNSQTVGVCSLELPKVVSKNRHESQQIRPIIFTQMAIFGPRQSKISKVSRISKASKNGQKNVKDEPDGCSKYYYLLFPWIQ